MAFIVKKGNKKISSRFDSYLQAASALEEAVAEEMKNNPGGRIIRRCDRIIYEIPCKSLTYFYVEEEVDQK